MGKGKKGRIEAAKGRGSKGQGKQRAGEAKGRGSKGQVKQRAGRIEMRGGEWKGENLSRSSPLSLCTFQLGVYSLEGGHIRIQSIDFCFSTFSFVSGGQLILVPQVLQLQQGLEFIFIKFRLDISVTKTDNGGNKINDTIHR